MPIWMWILAGVAFTCLVVGIVLLLVAFALKVEKFGDGIIDGIFCEEGEDESDG